MKKKTKAILQKGRGKERREKALVYNYEKDSIYFAQVSESVKELAVEELKELGAYLLVGQHPTTRFDYDTSTSSFIQFN